jgi:hypothetical protein
LSERAQLLADIRQVFVAADDPAELTTADLLDGLLAIDESPWRGWWGIERDGAVYPSKGAARKLSTHLRSFNIRSRSVGDTRQKGYRRADFEDAWKRYLPAPALSPAQPLDPHKPLEQAGNEPPGIRSEGHSPSGLGNPANPDG